MEFFVCVLLLAGGIALLVKGADLFVGGASDLAARLGIPPLVIGLTVVAMGTSIPEAAVSISAVIKGNAEITIGNVVGSNILNILIILGISAMIAPLSVKTGTIKHELPFLGGISILLLLQGLDGIIGFADGILHLFLFGLYLAYLFFSAKKGNGGGGETAAPRSEKKLWKIIFLCIFGLTLTVAGSNISVDAACGIAERLGMSQRFIGLTIVALGTSLPELVTSVMAAKKGKSDIAIGNIVGSNIFNILFVVGASALIRPVFYRNPLAFSQMISTGGEEK